MGVMYRLMYAVGFAPWDRQMPAELKAVIEGPDALPPARALDLGSGLGTKAIYMAGHGWDVTGVEAVPRALREAQRRAKAAGVRVDFRLGDVTRLGDLGYAEGVTPLAAPGASLYMMEFTHALPPIPSGVSESELRERFGQAWDLLWSKPSESGTPAMMRASAAWFCLKKR